VIPEVGRALLELLRPYLPGGTSLLLVRPGAPAPAPWGAPAAASMLVTPPLTPSPLAAHVGAAPTPLPQVGVPVLKDGEVGVPRFTDDGPLRGNVGVPVLEGGALGVPRFTEGGGAAHCAPAEAAPAVRLALCWLREEPEGRQSGDQDVRAADGTLLGRQAPARRYELRYLVTATAGTVEAEHELLDAVLLAVTGLDALPAERLPAGIADTGLPVFLRVCAEPALAAAGVPQCAGFELSVSAPLLPPLQTELAPPAAELAMGVRRPLPQRPAPQGPAQQRPAQQGPAQQGPAPAAGGNGRQWRRARVSEE
jgi:hypothetical protein